MDRITNLSEVNDALERLGYEPTLNEESVSLTVGQFPTVLTQNDDGDLVISCQLLTLGEIDQERLTEFAFSALDVNTRIRPFALSVITEHDDPSITEDESYPVILTNSVPMCDLQESEVEKAMDSLRAALEGSRFALEAGQPQPV